MESNENADAGSAEEPVARPPADEATAPEGAEPQATEALPAPATPPPAATTPAVPPPALIAPEPTAEAAIEPDSPPARRGRMPSARATVIALLLVAVVVESVLLFRGGSDERARNEVFDISRRFLSTLTTYNPSTIDAQRGRVLALATGRFRTEYTQLTGPEFVAALRDRQADSKGTVTRLAVTSIEGDNAEVMAVVDVSVANKDLPAPSVERNVIELSLVRTGSGWRIDAVSILGTLP